jgi:RHS repeat-associated protein
LTYDYESRLTSVTGPGITASYTYNGLDTRVGKTENGASQVYKRDGVDVTDDVLSDSSAFYTPGVSEKRAGTTSYLHGGLKNQTRQTNSSQTTTATRTYDAFGNVTSSSGTWNGPFGNAGSFGYQEDATGLKLLGHRYYDSSLGHFITRDPEKDGDNWYTYCDNDPINGVDEDGLKPGDLYDTPDEAAQAAIDENIGTSRKNRQEMGGWIYWVEVEVVIGGKKVKKRKYGYTAFSGSQGQINLNARRPKNAVAPWHTHPNFDGEPVPGSGGKQIFVKPDEPSPDDVYLAGGAPGGYGYIGSITGKSVKYNKNGKVVEMKRKKKAKPTKPRSEKKNGKTKGTKKGR